jgi:hypothetical protein
MIDPTDEDALSQAMLDVYRDGRRARLRELAGGGGIPRRGGVTERT